MSKFITYTSNGVNYIVRFSKNDGEERSNRIVFKYELSDGTTGTSAFTLTQQSRKYFKWEGETGNTTNLGEVEYNSGSGSKNFTTNYDNLSVVCDSSWARGEINSNTLTYSFDENINTYSRVCTFYIKSGNRQIGVATLKQIGSEASKYLWIVNQGNTSINLNTSSNGGNYSVQLLTNYDVSELRINGCEDIIESSSITNTKKLNIIVKQNTSIEERECVIIVSSDDKQVQINLKQSGEELMFIFTDTNSNISYLRFSDSEGCFEKEFTTNYSNLNYYTESDIITEGSVVLSEGLIKGNNNANDTTVGKTGVIYVKSGDEIVGTINLTQIAHGAYYFMFDNDSTASTIYTLATDTSISIGIETNYILEDIKVELEEGNTLDLTPNYTDVNIFNSTFSINEGNATRTAIVYFKHKTTNELLGKLIVNQYAEENKYFKWNKSNDKVLEISTEGEETSINEGFDTTYENVRFELEESCDWITTFEIEGSSLKVIFQTNETGSERTAKFKVKSNGQEISGCYLKLTQGVNGEFWFIIDDDEGEFYFLVDE